MNNNGVAIKVSRDVLEYTRKATYHVTFEDFLSTFYEFATKYITEDIIEDNREQVEWLGNATETILSQDFDMLMFIPETADMIVQRAVFGKHMFY